MRDRDLQLSLSLDKTHRSDGEQMLILLALLCNIKRVQLGLLFRVSVF
jgi:hypothetical protein